MSYLFIMVGISGSGKSTYGDKILNKLRSEGEDALVISTDAIRGELCNGDLTNQSKNREVFEIAHERIDQALGLGMNVIFDATSLCRESRSKPVAIGRKHNATIIAVVMCTPITVAIERNRGRDRVVPSPVIWKQQGRFYPPTKPEVDQIVNVDLHVKWPHWDRPKTVAQPTKE